MTRHLHDGRAERAAMSVKNMFFLTEWGGGGGVDGKLFGSRSGRTGLEPNIFRPARPYSVKILKNFFEPK